MDEFGNLISDSRTDFLRQLSDKNWFKNTSVEVKKQLFSLPEDFNGYIADLCTRKDEYGGLMVKKLEKILAGNYAVLSVFEVISLQTAQPFTYEYTSWKFGSDKGYRGLILFEEHGKIQYFLIRKSEKFAIGTEVFETIGTFIKTGHNTDSNIPEEVVKQIDKELGMKNIEIKKFYDLGKIAIDPVMANSTPSLWAAVIDLPGENDLNDIRQKIYKTKPISFNLTIEPIEKIWEYTQKTDESFFLAIVARLKHLGVIR